MLKPLQQLVGGWKPAGGAASRRNGAHSPSVGDVLAIWSLIVGSEVAKHAVPIERSGETLVILTTSSSWSNQLSLLSGHVIGALNEGGIAGVERLRFRVGRPRRSAIPRKRETSNGNVRTRVPDDVKPSETLGEAVSRLRERLIRDRDAKRAAGWNTCSQCGVMLPEGDRCAPCTTAELSERSARVQRLMFDVPWLGYLGIAELVTDLTRHEFDANRKVLLARWWEALERVRKTGKVSGTGRERQIASSYLLLRTGWEPERITPVIARSQLGDELYNLLYEKHHNK
ncbi:MAG: DciA family protein [Vulcanimicrobiaceae bacterium]